MKQSVALAIIAISLLVTTGCKKQQKEYVDIADWCRLGMTEPITAQEWAKTNNAFGLKFLRKTKGNAVFSPYSIERVTDL